MSSVPGRLRKVRTAMLPLHLARKCSLDTRHVSGSGLGQKTEPSGWRMEWNDSIANAFQIFCYKKRGNEVAAGGRGQVYFR